MNQTSYRGKTFTYDDVIQALDRFDKEFRATFPNKYWVTYAIRHNEKNYPPKQVMRLITGLQKVGKGGKPLNARYEDLGFNVVVLEDDEPTTLDGTFQDELETEIALSLEYDLENSLITNLEQLERGLKLYTDGEITGQQYNTKVAGIIDLLAIDANGNWVVIELKAAEADRQVCGQIQAYMGWVKEELAEGKKVRGIIVANDFTVRAVYAAKVVPDLTLKKYQINFRFTDAQALASST